MIYFTFQYNSEIILKTEEGASCVNGSSSGSAICVLSGNRSGDWVLGSDLDNIVAEEKDFEA